MAQSLIYLVRLGLLSTVLLFSVIVFGISANLIHLDNEFFDGFIATPAFTGFALFVSIVTFITVIPLLVFDILKKGTALSLVFVELIWTALLGIFWLASAADTTTWGWFWGSCDFAGDDDIAVGDVGDGTGTLETVNFSSICHQYQALQAFSWLNWLILWGWLGVVFVLSIISLSRGNKRVFLSPTTETDYFARHEKVPAAQPQHAQVNAAQPATIPEQAPPV